MTVLEEASQIEVAGQELQLFDESAPLMDAMLADIRRARERVWLESYIFAADAAGQAIADALKQRATAGVDCRVMYDALGSNATPAAFFEDLEQAGVQVHAYHTLFHAFFQRSFFRVLNQRNHRKLLVVDDRVGYFGGMNIVDQSGILSVADAKARNLPASAGWRDLHVRLAGPKQAELADGFDRLWRLKHRLPRKRGPRWPVRDMLKSQDDGIWFFDSRPGMRFRSPARVFVPLIKQARTSITLSMAYFIPVGDVLKELLRARRRGVNVRVIIPGHSDVPVVQWATRHFYDKLLRRGIRLYERKDQMLHSKAMVVDGLWSVIGSCNLDPRSLRWNLEFLSVIRSQRLAQAVTEICAYEMRNSQRVRLRDWHARRWWQRLLDRMAWSVRKWL
jgi:cardiolipin synthase